MAVQLEKIKIGFIPANRGFFSSELAAKWTGLLATVDVLHRTLRTSRARAGARFGNKLSDPLDVDSRIVALVDGATPPARRWWNVLPRLGCPARGLTPSTSDLRSTDWSWIWMPRSSRRMANIEARLTTVTSSACVIIHCSRLTSPVI